MIYYSVLKAFNNMDDGEVMCINLGHSSVRFTRVGDELIFTDERRGANCIWRCPPENVAECYGDRCIHVTIEDNRSSIRYV